MHKMMVWSTVQITIFIECKFDSPIRDSLFSCMEYTVIHWLPKKSFHSDLNQQILVLWSGVASVGQI